MIRVEYAKANKMKADDWTGLSFVYTVQEPGPGNGATYSGQVFPLQLTR